ncbi:hypothetical protein BDZ97DRAFT_1911383 [Flammula alnicola]|nr:hypothetical protein BDZ97DRAFT_1911383 [Flammula alnicola]
MHFRPVLFFLFYVLQLVTAVPASSSSSHSSSSSSSSTSHRSSSIHIPHTLPSTRPNSILGTHAPVFPTHTRIPPVPNNPVFTNAPTHTRDPFQGPSHASQPSQKPISIVFEVLGGLFAVALLLGFLRCFHNYRKTPHRDRIADILQRHQLHRELEELERNPAALRRPSLREPAPPYFPRPPSYDAMNPSLPAVSILPRASAPPRTEYSAVNPYSPPPSPPMSERILLPTPAVAPRTHPELPSG